MTQVTTPNNKSEKKNPFQVPAGSRAILLVPFSDALRDKTSELLFAAGHEELPKIVTSLRLVKLNDNDIVFTAVPVVTKLDQRKQPKEYALKLGKGVFVSKYSCQDKDEDLEPDYAAIVDALAVGAHPACRVTVSEDQICKLLP